MYKTSINKRKDTPSLCKICRVFPKKDILYGKFSYIYLCFCVIFYFMHTYIIIKKYVKYIKVCFKTVFEEFDIPHPRNVE